MHQIPFLSLQERPPLSDTSETPFFMRIEQIMMLLSRHVKRKKSRAVLAAFISFSYKNHLTALQIAEQWRGELETSRAIRIRNCRQHLFVTKEANMNDSRRFSLFVILTPVFFILTLWISVFPHEYAHAITAWIYGYKLSPFEISFGDFNW